MYILHYIGIAIISWLVLGIVVTSISLLVMSRISKTLGFYEGMTERILYGAESAKQKYEQQQKEFEEENLKWSFIDWVQFALSSIVLWPECLCSVIDISSKNLQLIKACKIRLNAHDMSKKEDV